MSITIPNTIFEYWVHRYVNHMRALGRRFDYDEWILLKLCYFLSQRKSEDLDLTVFEHWIGTHHHMHANVRRKFQCVVRKLCLYRQRSEPDCFVPDASRFPQRRAHRAPVIFGPPEVTRMLQAADDLRYHAGVPLRRAVFRLAIVLLYTAGLRRCEVVRLTLKDVDVTNGTVMIRDTKFSKSRLVPLSNDAQRELQTYLKHRLSPPWDTSPDAPLLGHQHNLPTFRPYSTVNFYRNIRELLIAADVRDADGRLPTVHDFRHSFAVQALLRWYRAEVDVQSCLPKLAMYMGHVSIVSTAYYLRWIPEVATAASTRFEREFGHLIQGETP